MITYKKFITFILPWVGLALVMNITRQAMTDVPSYIYMNLNLFLALLPLIFLFFFEKTKNVYFKALFFFAWLMLLPNSPYMVSDLIHLRNVGPDWMLWFDGMMIFSYALVGVYVASYSLLKMRNNLSKNIKIQNIFLVLISILTAFGIYLGRYVRLNTWEIITEPVYFAENVVSVLTTQYFNPIFLTIIIFFTLFILVSTESMKKLFQK